MVSRHQIDFSRVKIGSRLTEKFIEVDTKKMKNPLKAMMMSLNFDVVLMGVVNFFIFWKFITVDRSDPR